MKKAIDLTNWKPTAKGVTVSTDLAPRFMEIIELLDSLGDWSDGDELKAAGGQKTKDGSFVNYNWPVGANGLVVSVSRRGKTEPYLNIRKWVKE